MVVDELMHAAARLFAEFGVAGTSMQQLAEAVGLTRTGIYHYFKSKDEMLEALVKGFTLETARNLEQLAKEDDTAALERLRAGVRFMVLKVAQNPERFRLLLTSEGAFSEDLARAHQSARRRTLQAIIDLIGQSMEEGACQPVNPELAAFALLGTSNWVAMWYGGNPKATGVRASTPERVADELTEIAIGGLAADRRSPDGDPTAYLLSLLREDIDRLEQAIDPAGS